MRSFLNVIDLASGRQIRAAEFGFYAESPAFRRDNEILFYRSGKPFILSLETGIVSAAENEVLVEPPSSGARVYLDYKSRCYENIAYVELILENASDRRILARFMGGDASLGARPLDSNFGKVVFFGYTED